MSEQKNAPDDAAVKKPDRIRSAAAARLAKPLLRRVSCTRRYRRSIGGFLYDADKLRRTICLYWLMSANGSILSVRTLSPTTIKPAAGRQASARAVISRYSPRVRRSTKPRRPRMMTVSLHSRVSGQPARFEAVVRFLDLVGQHSDVWIAGRSDVARHWIATIRESKQ